MQCRRLRQMEGLETGVEEDREAPRDRQQGHSPTL